MSQVAKCEACGGLFNERHLRSHQRLSHAKQVKPAAWEASEAVVKDEILSGYEQLSNEAQAGSLDRLNILSREMQKLRKPFRMANQRVPAEQGPARSDASKGFSLIELVVVTAIVLILTAIAVPSIVRSWNTYKLSGTASDVDRVIKQARYEAIRLNTVINCLVVQKGSDWLIGVDQNNNGVIDPTEPQVLLAGPAEILPDGVAPGPTSMGYPNAKVPNGSISFDSRGTVYYGPGNPAVIYVIYLGFPNQPEYGFRAITVLPGGTTKTWSAGNGDSWHSP